MCVTVFTISKYFSRFSILVRSAALSVQFLTAKVSQLMSTIFLGMWLNKFNKLFDKTSLNCFKEVFVYLLS